MVVLSELTGYVRLCGYVSVRYCAAGGRDEEKGFLRVGERVAGGIAILDCTKSGLGDELRIVWCYSWWRRERLGGSVFNVL